MESADSQAQAAMTATQKPSTVAGLPDPEAIPGGNHKPGERHGAPPRSTKVPTMSRDSCQLCHAHQSSRGTCLELAGCLLKECEHPELKAFYRRYLQRCNAHRFDELAEFVARDVR